MSTSIAMQLAIGQIMPLAAQPPLEQLKDPEYWIQACNIAIEEQPETRLKNCEQAIQLQPKDASLWTRYAALQLNLKQFSSTQLSLSQARKYDSNNSRIEFLQCLVWLNLGNYSRAETACEQATQINQKWGNLSADQIKPYHNLIRHYQQVESTYGSQIFHSIRKSFDRTTIASTSKPIIDIQRYKAQLQQIQRYAQAKRQYQRGKFPKAIQTFNRILSQTPKHLESWIYQGHALSQLQKPTAALSAYAQAVALAPNQSAVLFFQCRTLNQLQQSEAALRACQTALQGDQNWSNTSLANTWSQQAQALYRLGKAEAALAATNRAIGMQIPPNCARLLIKGSSPLPPQPGTLNCGAIFRDHAVILWYLQQYETALTSIQKTLAINPTDAKALANQGRIRRSLKHLEAALISYQASVALNPKDARSWINLSALWWQVGNYTKSLIAANNAVKANPQLAEAYQNQAIALVALKNDAEAQKSYEKAILLSPDNSNLQTGLGLVLTRRKYYPEALTVLQHSLELDPNQPLVTKTIQVLIQWQKVQQH
ncbi:tetratricopeptide repeat protein [filamentous cyanobacterium LEGE 11480]|uniref:Tetratricopeptide repeat protein n=1 Tax=Romeriopsis navalis LEGE 11480 TaxID=2777977 RepID=A0A928Z5W1_9CYAN|nr:tetratricopeptide repeat protein [Romeriopsis navalis]MBE9032402.1 tetratricopeptide repeat protein [Romeriopsis navalis LEGE 11480]